MTENLPSQLAVVGLGYVGLPLAAAFSKVARKFEEFSKEILAPERQIA